MTYVMSDIHGNMRRFQSILRQIDLQPQDTLYILGDVIDRHPQGLKILRQIMEMPNVKMLLGNHEYMMLRAIGEPYDGPEDIRGRDPDRLLQIWYQNGGEVTHRSWKHTRKDVRANILSYLKALPLNIDITVDGKKYKLVHAAALDRFEEYEPGNPSKSDRTHFAVWDRNASIDSFTPKGYTLIFGHTPTEHFQPIDPLAIWHSENRIGIDCGAGYPDGQDIGWWFDHGRLACLCLDSMREFYSEEPGLDKLIGEAD